MNCPNCDAPHTIVTRTEDGDHGVRRIRLCLACHAHFETLEQPAGLVAGRAYQASLFNAMVNGSREKAREIISNHREENGQCLSS